MQKRNAIFGLLLFTIVAFCVCSTHIHNVYVGKGARAWSVERLISEYIQENDGQFPRSQKDLMEKGYLKIEYKEGRPKYFNKVTFYQQAKWQEWPVHLEWFTIRYGAKKEDFIVVDGALCEKNRQEVFLLDGPYNRKMEPALRRTYRMISLKWYELMKGESQGERIPVLE